MFNQLIKINLDIRKIMETMVENEFEKQEKLKTKASVQLQTIRDKVSMELCRLNTSCNLQMDWLNKQTRILIKHEQEKTSQIRIVADKVLKTAIHRTTYIRNVYEPGILWSDYTTVTEESTSTNRRQLDNCLTMISNIKSSRTPVLDLTMIPQTEDINQYFTHILTEKLTDPEVWNEFSSQFKYGKQILLMFLNLPTILQEKTAELIKLQSSQNAIIRSEIENAQTKIETARKNLIDRLRANFDLRKNEAYSKLGREFSQQIRLLSEQITKVTVNRTVRNESRKSVGWFRTTHEHYSFSRVQQDSIAESMIEQTKQNLIEMSSVSNALGYVEQNKALTL